MSSSRDHGPPLPWSVPRAHTQLIIPANTRTGCCSGVLKQGHQLGVPQGTSFRVGLATRRDLSLIASVNDDPEGGI